MAQTKGQTIEGRGLWDQGVASLQTQPLAERQQKSGHSFHSGTDLRIWWSRENCAVQLSLSRSLLEKRRKAGGRALNS